MDNKNIHDQFKILPLNTPFNQSGPCGPYSGPTPKKSQPSQPTLMDKIVFNGKPKILPPSTSLERVDPESL